jgi:predicted CoA-binding protein
MPADACPLPAPLDSDEIATISRLLKAQRIAIVGLSDDPSRPSHEIATYLISVGKEILPINPNHREILGRPCYPTLADVPGPIDLVNVFRKPEACAEIARDAIAAGAKGIWLQSGITNRQARELARKAGVDYVENQCILVQHTDKMR